MIGIQTYTENINFVVDATELINNIVSEAKSKYSCSNILLSGGSTPGPIYNSLNGIKDFSNNLNIGLVNSFSPRKNKLHTVVIYPILEPNNISIITNTNIKNP